MCFNDLFNHSCLSLHFWSPMMSRALSEAQAKFLVSSDFDFCSFLLFNSLSLSLFISLSHSLSLFISLSHSLSLLLSLSHTHTLSLSFSHSQTLFLSLSHTLSPSLSLKKAGACPKAFACILFYLFEVASEAFRDLD